MKEVSTQGNWKSIKAKLNVEDLEGKVFESFDTTNETITDCINLALSGTGWIVGTCDVTRRRTVRKTNSSSWDIIQEARKVYRCELEFDTLNKRVNIYEKRGSDKGVYFLDSLNLKDLSIQGDSYDFYTRIIAKGKDDLKVTLENFQYSSKAKTYIWKDERYTDIDSLTEDAEAKLDELSKPYRAYSATIIDLANISKEDYKDILSYGLGDVITLVSKENRIKEKQRIVKIVEYPDEPTRNTCEIANTTLSFEDIQKEFQDTTDTVNNITTDNGTVDGSTIDGISTEQIYDFEASVAKITDLTVVNARIDNLYAEKANVGELNAVVANVAELNATKANISDLNVINANIDKLVANDATINNALIGKADITELNAVQGNITSLNSQVANIQTLVNGNLSSENIQAGGITSDKLTIANGFITNAMIANLDVSKINAGNISTNKFKIVSDNGGIEIVGATQQFKDKNNKVRIQMGQDAQGNFNFILRGADGTTTLIDHTGIKQNAIADDLIIADMIANDAVGEKQIDYSSFSSGFNKDTNTSTLKATKIKLNNQNQTLEVAFNSLKTQSDNNKSTTESNSTTIGVMQGQITTAINNTQIVKDGQTILLKDDYNITVSKVDSINSIIGTHSTKINELTGSISSVDTKVNSVQRDLEGTKSTVSSHTSQINGLNSTVSTQGSSISQLKNQIALKVEATDVTEAINNVQIGGRNLLTKKVNVVYGYIGSGDGSINNSGSLNGNQDFYNTNYIELKRGESISFRSYKTSVNSTIQPAVYIHIYNSSKVWQKSNYNVGSVGGVAKTIYTATEDCYIRLCARGFIDFNHKAELSTKHSDWTPAPEDVDANVDTKISSAKSEIKLTTDAITQRVSSVETSISKKANSSDVYGKGEVYTKSETYTKNETDSKINIAKDAINLGVSQTYETKTNVETKVTNAINGIQIGGSNLVTKKVNVTYGYLNSESGVVNNSGSLNSNQDFYNTNYILLKNGESITFKSHIKQGVTSTIQPGVYIHIYNTSKVWQKSANKTGNVNTDVVVTYKATADCYVRLCSRGFNDYNHMAEKGTKASDYSPAPEDVQNLIDAKASKTDVYTKSEVYTKSQTDSAINVVKDAINLGVSNTYETKTNVESKINVAVTGIKVGGSNVLRNGNFVYGMNSWSIHDMNSGGSSKSVVVQNGGTDWMPSGKKVLVIKGTNTIDRYGVISSSMKLIPKTSYTISGYCAGHRVGSILINMRDLNNSSANIYSKNVSVVSGGSTLDKWHRFELTFTTTTNSDFALNLYAVNFANDGYVWFSDVQIQQGTKATAWTPCSTDIDADIGSKANSSDVYKKAETYTKNETDSKINIAKDSINLGVSQTYETKTNVESKVSSSLSSAKSYADIKKTEAINSANNTTIEKLKSYSTTTQMNSAINVAKDSITNTVSATYATKSDVSQTYATKSSLTQTTDKIVADFKASGGYNLLKNSDAKNGTSFWISNGGGISLNTAGLDPFVGQKEFKTSFPHGMRYAEDLKLKANTDYVYEAWVYTNTAISSNSLEPLHFWCSSSTGTSGQSQCTIIDYRQTLTTNKYTKVYVHFKTKSGNVYFRPFIYSPATAGSICVKQISLSEGIVESPWTPHPDEVYSGSTIIDASGVTVNNGALTVKNKSGTTVLSGDSNGNLNITGEMRSQSGQQWVGLNAGGLTFQDWNRNEQMLRMGLAYFSANRDMNGVEFAMPQYSDFLRFTHIAKADLNNGWSSSDTTYNFFELWSGTHTFGGTTRKKGMTVHAPIYVNNGIKLYSGNSYTSDISGDVTWNTIGGLMGVCGDNGAFIGYKSGDSLQARIVATEGAHPGTGDNIKSWGNWNLSEGTIHNGHFNGKSLTISGSKNCIQETENYGQRLINAYETAEYYFGDLGVGQINEDGECLISIDDIFLECINTDAEYHVFTQVYNGSIKIIERHKTYFIVKGDLGTSFSWEIKAKRKGYENNRLDLQDIETQFESGLELFSDEDFKVKTSEDALLNSITFELENLLMEE